jgi:hypothetical protein
VKRVAGDERRGSDIYRSLGEHEWGRLAPRLLGVQRYNIIRTREDVNNVELQVLIFPLSNSLGIDSDYLRERFDEAKSLPTYISSNIKENASPPI